MYTHNFIEDNYDSQSHVNCNAYDKKIRFSDFDVEGVIGKGGYGIVYLVQFRKQKEKGIYKLYALKEAPKSKLKKDSLFESAKLERDIQALYRSKFIIQLFLAFQDHLSVYFVLEFAQGGDAFSLINKGSDKHKEFITLGQKAVQFIAGCVILALQFLHANSLMFRDLKPENVLLCKNGYAKLVDFGLAKKFMANQVEMGFVGTPIYYAPEMVLGLGYNKDIDLWTFGVFLYEISIFESPFTPEQICRTNFKKACIEGQEKRNWRKGSISPELKELINKLLKLDAKSRIGAQGKWNQIKNHIFFEGLNWNDLQSGTIESPLKELVQKYPTSVKQWKVRRMEHSDTDKQSNNSSYNKVSSFSYNFIASIKNNCD